jgi:hypothetical protein
MLSNDNLNDTKCTECVALPVRMAPLPAAPASAQEKPNVYTHPSPRGSSLVLCRSGCGENTIRLHEQSSVPYTATISGVWTMSRIIVVKFKSKPRASDAKTVVQA